ncbi:MAG: acyl-CoA thioesterase [Chloroflexi bacterium]|nr:acyl-CoA thioesterase [Chloroflexota bacterium]
MTPRRDPNALNGATSDAPDDASPAPIAASPAPIAASPAPDDASPAPDDASPAPAGSVQVRTRWDDCDSNGHVNNAAYVALMRAAHDRAGMPVGRLRELTIANREPLGPEVLVDIGVSVLEADASHRRIAYALRAQGRLAAQVEAVWQDSGPTLEVELPRIARDAGGRPFRFSQVVRSHEVAPDGAARPQAILQWLEHAVFRAAARAGWPGTRMEAANFLSLVVGHDLVLEAPARDGDELVVTSRLIELRRVSGTWHHEIHRADGALVATDRARGAFLDRAGRIRSAPAEMLEELLGGEPAD